MAVVKADDLHLQNVLAAEFGNENMRMVEVEISDNQTKDDFVLAVLPPGMEIYEIVAVVEDALGNGVTVDVGVWDSQESEGAGDGDFFFDGLGVTSAKGESSLGANGTRHRPALVPGDKPRYLVCSLSKAVGGGNNDGGKLRFYIHQIYRGLS